MPKMRHYFIALAGVFSALAYIACEKTTSQADIVNCFLSENVLRENAIITEDSIYLMLIAGKADIQQLAPMFQLGEEVTIDPPSGTIRDFSQIQTYETTSGNGTKHTYVVKVFESELITHFDFEQWQKTNHYEHPCQTRMFPGGICETQAYWSSGNGGFALTGMGNDADSYPACKIEDAYQGNYALKMETRSAGMFGKIANKPIAAGSLFLGEFDASSAVKAPLKATRFGTWFNKKPIALKGYYRYYPGDEVTDAKGKTLSQYQDTFNISGVLYETSNTVDFLDATNTIRTAHPSDRIIAAAYMEGANKQDTWTAFEVPFDYEAWENPFDIVKSANSIYKVSISLSSSKGGGDFIGAVGSQLWIDELELIYE